MLSYSISLNKTFVNQSSAFNAPVPSTHNTKRPPLVGFYTTHSTIRTSAFNSFRDALHARAIVIHPYKAWLSRESAQNNPLHQPRRRRPGIRSHNAPIDPLRLSQSPLYTTYTPAQKKSRSIAAAADTPARECAAWASRKVLSDCSVSRSLARPLRL